MLKFFFHRRSWMVRLMNAVTLAVILWLGWDAFLAAPVEAPGVGTGFLIFSWVFFQLLDHIPWYHGAKARRGIRVHFEKNLVPVSYLTAVALTGRLLGLPDLAMVPFGILMLPMYYVSIVLLYLHFNDPSPLPPGYYSDPSPEGSNALPSSEVRKPEVGFPAAVSVESKELA